MKYDVLLAGVGGQGILSAAAVIAAGALEAGLQVKQSEVHGMAQRGGAVLAHLRLADRPIHSDLISLGGADMVLSMEPVESLRYLDHLGPTGIVVTSSDPVENVPDYPHREELVEAIRTLPRALVVPAGRLALESGASKGANLVMAGAASHFLPLDPDLLRTCVRRLFAAKGVLVVEANLSAFEAGRASVAAAVGGGSVVGGSAL